MASNAENVSIWWRHHIMLKPEYCGITMSISWLQMPWLLTPPMILIMQYRWVPVFHKEGFQLSVLTQDKEWKYILCFPRSIQHDDGWLSNLIVSSIRSIHNIYKNISRCNDTSMVLCKTAVSPLLTHWIYCSLQLNHRHNVINFHAYLLPHWSCWYVHNVIKTWQCCAHYKPFVNGIHR